MSSAAIQRESPWPHRLAVVLVCATFPLIWVGGMVTTYGAGMAVPDWPTTFGYNPFLYPWQTWILGPFDVFIEHGHRLLGAAVGILTILLALAMWRCERRGWVRMLSILALVAVVLQGSLGGLRVIFNEVQLAKIHGCFGPAFFALTVALAVVTSPRWRHAVPRGHAAAGSVQWLAVLTTLFAYVQLVLGAQLRHVSPDMSPSQFQTAVFFHLVMAGVVALTILILAVRVWRSFGREWALAAPASILAGLVLVQLGLGAAAWVSKYGWPAWLGDSFATYTVQAQGYAQALAATGHVATGSLIVAVSLVVSLRSRRLLVALPRPAPSPALAGEAVA